MTLKELGIGQSARILTVGGEGALRQHFLDMGVIPKAEVTVIKFAPMGDPMELQVHGYELTLRLDDAAQIEVELIDSRSRKHEGPKKISNTAHPGLGEEGKYHVKGSGNPLPDGEKLTYALVGNQNCGKTTLFNQLTGSNQHVGNFPGVTVDRKDGSIKEHPDTSITDLPGIYSMSPYTNEEIVSRNFVLDNKPKAIINIVDATNIERNLYLTMQLLEMDIPMVIALNMMDEVTANSGLIDVNKIEGLLGVPVVPISAAKNQGVDELVRHAIHIAKYQEHPGRQDFCDENDFGGAVHRCIHAVSHLIEDHAKLAGVPIRFAATKIIEGDALILEQLHLDENEKEAIEHLIVQMEKERGLDRSAAIADMRFTFIEKICESTVVKPKESRERIRSERIDRVLTGKYTAIPCFIVIMLAVFYLMHFIKDEINRYITFSCWLPVGIRHDLDKRHGDHKSIEHVICRRRVRSHTKNSGFLLSHPFQINLLVTCHPLDCFILEDFQAGTKSQNRIAFILWRLTEQVIRLSSRMRDRKRKKFGIQGCC